MQPEISRTDYLALERTNLANERTLLAYSRSFAVFLSSGFAIIKIELFQNMLWLGYFLIAASIAMISIGIVRFFHVKRRLKRYFE